MLHRDPQTGQFTTMDGDEYEYVHLNDHLWIPDGNLGGAGATLYGEETEFEGRVILDVEDIVDRHEVARLVHAESRVEPRIITPQTGTMGSIRGAFEVSASPARQVIGELDNTSLLDDQTGVTVQGQLYEDDTADLPLLPLTVTMHSGMDDGTNGVGAGAFQTSDESRGPTPGSWDFDRRDEMYLNGVLEYNNVDADVHIEFVHDLVFAIEED